MSSSAIQIKPAVNEDPELLKLLSDVFPDTTERGLMRDKIAMTMTMASDMNKDKEEGLKMHRASGSVTVGPVTTALQNIMDNEFKG